MSTVAEKLGRNIARQRNAVGLTQAELADKVGVQPETVSRVETGSRTASLDLLENVARALEVELHDLFRLHDGDDPRQRALERLSFFASRLSGDEIDLVMDVGADVLGHVRSTLTGRACVERLCSDTPEQVSRARKIN